MPNVQPAVDTFMAEITLIEESFEKDLKVLAGNLKKMSDTELIQANSQLNFLQELSDRGYGSALDKFDGEYTRMLAAAVKEARKRGIDPLAGASVEGLQVLRELDYERLLGRASSYALDLQAQLFRGVYGGSSISQITSKLSETKLASHQLNLQETSVGQPMLTNPKMATQNQKSLQIPRLELGVVLTADIPGR